MDVAVRATGLHKRFGKKDALSGVDLAVPAGTVCGLLGPNGAGKTTVVRILATLLRPDSGTATVAGFDVVREAQHARYRIGLAGQNAAVDELLSGRANLAMVGRLYHLSPRLAGRRADELLERFDLTEAGRRPVKTYSGGMRRRLDLAASLLVAPPVLFLDEPTTGIDPGNRLQIWDMIADLVTRGTTVLLTTQYLDEADRLADQIVLLHHGKVAAAGTPTQLKSSVGGEQVDVVLRERQQVPEAVRAVRQATGAEPEVRVEECRLTVPVEGGAAALIRVARALDEGAIAIDDIALRHPTLDEVFLRLTARPDLSPAESPRFRASDTVEVSR